MQFFFKKIPEDKFRKLFCKMILKTASNQTCKWLKICLSHQIQKFWVLLSDSKIQPPKVILKKKKNSKKVRVFESLGQVSKACYNNGAQKTCEPTLVHKFIVYRLDLLGSLWRQYLKI